MGRTVDVSAPGENIYVPRANFAEDRSYGYGSGTSYAAPHVTGLITCLWCLEPLLTYDQVRSLVTDDNYTVNTEGGTRPRIDAFAAAIEKDSTNTLAYYSYAKAARFKYNLNGLDYLLFLGRIDPIKRVDWLFDLAGVLREGIKLVIAGSPQDSATDFYFQQLFRKSRGNASIIFTGAVSGVEKAELLSNCLLFLAPSSYEGLPITVLEAVAYGRCCVVSDIPAHSELIEDGRTGFLFPTCDRSAFVRLIRLLISKPKDSITSIGSQAKKRFKRRHNWANTSASYEQLYRGLLDGKR